MKYKVLLTGNNKMIINEFFTYMDFSFECINTSDRYDDILSHMKYIHPDIFVYCLLGERPDDIKRFINVEHKISEYRIPIVIIGDADECDMFMKVAPMVKVTFIQKPITSQNIEKKIVKILDERQQIKEELGIASEAVNQAASDGQEYNSASVLAEFQDPDIERALRELQEETNAAPAASGKPAPAAAHAPAMQSSGRKHILIVDDDSSVLKLIRGYLAERYDVATAISGKVALKFLETKKTDLVLLDYEMPGENGPSVLGKIRSNANTKDLPVVFLTGVTDRDKIQEVLAMKPQGYLLKPIEMERLSSTIKGILG